TYVSSKLVKKDKFSPYKYWEDHRVEFPVLRALAQLYLTAPATSAESERMFSTGTAIYNYLRQRMTGPTFQKLLFLSRNIPIYGF
ncbi:Protein F53G12.11, partial [Aphelenchoides avenae]